MSTEASGSERPVVLVVDDERGLADLYAVWLDETCDTRVAYGGQAALDELDDSIDIVFLDRRMPTLSGDDVAAEIRAKGLDCRICMVTAVDADFDLIELGVDDYLEKPVSQAQLQAVVDRLAARARLPERLRPLLADLSKLVAIEESKSGYVQDDAHSRVQDRVASQLTELNSEYAGVDRETLATAIREPDDDSTVTKTITHLRNQLSGYTQVDG
jgi:DNA-binding response OmpR family regulator